MARLGENRDVHRGARVALGANEEDIERSCPFPLRDFADFPRGRVERQAGYRYFSGGQLYLGGPMGADQVGIHWYRCTADPPK
jgi:hypothetical protein